MLNKNINLIKNICGGKALLRVEGISMVHGHLNDK